MTEPVLDIRLCSDRTIGLDWAGLSAWTGRPVRSDQNQSCILDALKPVQEQVTAYQQAIQNHQGNVEAFHQAIHDFRTTAIPSLNQAVQACQALDSSQNRHRMNQAIQNIRQAGQVVADAGYAVQDSGQQVETTDVEMRQAIQAIPDLTGTDQDIQDALVLKQEIQNAVQVRKQIIQMSEQTIQNHQQAQQETDLVVQQANQVIRSRQSRT